MATAYNRTREQLRDMVLRKLRVLGADESPSAADAEIVYEAIDLRMKALHALPGILWWKTLAVQSTLTISSETVVGPSDILFPVTLMIENGSEQTPVELITHREYAQWPDKTTPAYPEAAHFSNGVFYFVQPPDDAYTAKITYEKIISNTEPGGNVDMPSQFILPFRTIVAADLIDDFAIPEDRAKRLISEAAMAMQSIKILNASNQDVGTVEADYF